ncbi:Enoyl-CoA hydratase/carnithine racemase [Variovorax sp. OK605]|jgi:enoyl-CoA hydratase/carnithine racemase|uniref:enoyl-CoA hydratase/isomerase family protein n=1 Tax=unclassified Variovorax TaxID=663243 RepID=UPI0008CE3A39|nr:MULTISPECIES: enoyl-CoA hydratase/isomerase family protein [unclassified Variovorax]SEK10344.1 Enoyl-CoA hydratase/carnithine racemase [Variovorax sp. OK202]SFD67508.1 Enoyl-CoA hydratase/carnithine racemase [Variovorax sp. OK212]SFQ11043.1 Enoyl-CoA hydratase/carnithine racemase [Variovorax sp. OK605]
MHTHDPVLVERLGEIAVVRLNRPDVLNAVDAGLRAALTRQLYALDADSTVGAIVLTGSGERAFCGGQDLDESATIDTGTLAAWLNRQHAMYQAVRDVAKPIVAALNGTAVGAGFQMALMCDLRVAHPALRMGQPEVKAGLASIVGSYLMSLQIGHSLNQQLSLTGELVSGERAHALGLVNDLVPAEQVLPRAIERARALAALPGAALRTTKQRFRERTQPGFEEACSAGIRYQLECYSTGEPQRVMREFIARRDAPRTSTLHKD